VTGAHATVAVTLRRARGATSRGAQRVRPQPARRPSRVPICSPLQDHVAQEARSQEQPCPSCLGSGLQPCMCLRWSDGDRGCSTCNHTGYMRCRSCGGGGRAVPIKASLPAQR
jgi:hypothetical protein